jgi:hypothetical protein
MERARRRGALPFLAAALLAAGCGGSGGGTAQSEDDGAWMDGAEVQVVIDEAARRETVTLVDAASGRSERLDEEEIVRDVAEFEDE